MGCVEGYIVGCCDYFISDSTVELTWLTVRVEERCMNLATYFSSTRTFERKYVVLCSQARVIDAHQNLSVNITYIHFMAPDALEQLSLLLPLP